MKFIVGVLKWVVYVAVGLAVVVSLFVFGVRFADGPYGLLPGGAFASGKPHQGVEPDWSIVTDRQEVEFQLLDPERSRTTWVLEHEGRIYIPCGYMRSTLGRIWKQWPIEAERDGRAVLRVDGVLYDRQLVRIKEGAQLPFVFAELGRKYLYGDAEISPEDRALTLATVKRQVADDTLWIFELAPIL